MCSINTTATAQLASVELVLLSRLGAALHKRALEKSMKEAVAFRNLRHTTTGKKCHSCATGHALSLLLSMSETRQGGVQAPNAMSR